MATSCGTGQKPVQGPCGLILGFFLAVVYPATLIAGLPTHKWNLVDLAPLVVTSYAGLRVGFLQLRGSARLITLCHWLFVYIFLGVIPLLQFVNGAGFPWEGQTYSGKTVLHAYSCILTGLIACDVGAWVARNRRPDNLTCATHFLFSRPLHRRRVYLLAVAAAITSGVMIAKIGGTATLFAARIEQGKLIEALAGGEGQIMIQIWFSLLRTPSAAGFLCLLVLYVGSRRKFGPLGISWLLLCGALVILISNPVSSPRFWVGTIVFATIFIATRWNDRRSVAVVSITVVLAFTVVFPFADLYRATLDVSWREKIADKGILQVLAEKPDFDSVQQTLNTVEYVNAEGFTHGRQLLGTALFWIPRGIWPDKPEPTSILVAEQQGYAFKNLSLPLWAEVYIDGGLPLTFLAFFLYGVFATRAEERYITDRARHASTFATVFVPIFAPYQFFLLRGSLMPAVAYFVPLFACMLLNTSRVRSQASVPRGHTVFALQPGIPVAGVGHTT